MLPFCASFSPSPGGAVASNSLELRTGRPTIVAGYVSPSGLVAAPDSGVSLTITSAPTLPSSSSRTLNEVRSTSTFRRPATTALSLTSLSAE